MQAGGGFDLRSEKFERFSVLIAPSLPLGDFSDLLLRSAIFSAKIAA